MVIDPDRLLEEIDGLEQRNVPARDRLRIDGRAHLILDLHRALDGGLEQSAQDDAIGTTRRGIGPTYATKALRIGVRLFDISSPERLRQRVHRLQSSAISDWLMSLSQSSDRLLDSIEARAVGWWSRLERMVCDVSLELGHALAQDKRVLFEGAQGALLDTDHGNYPFVTSSPTTSGGVSPGLGVAPRDVGTVIPVFKAYQTRVGAGPMPTELTDQVGQSLRDAGHEFGTTTGRPRRCGWFDAVAARQAIRINGAHGIALTKFDVLSGINPLRICTSYRLDGETIDRMPAHVDELLRVQPVYEEFNGWSEQITEIQDTDQLPTEAQRYLMRIGELCGCEISILSVGPDRRQTVFPQNSSLSGYARNAQ